MMAPLSLLHYWYNTVAGYTLWCLFATPFSSHVPGNISHELWIGGGFKIPTGAFKVNVNNSSTTLADINSQIGTGSLDLFFNARHTMELNEFGINSSVNYKIALANNQGYKYGNKITVNSIAYYKIKSNTTESWSGRRGGGRSLWPWGKTFTL